MRSVAFFLKMSGFGLLALACGCCRADSREGQAGQPQSSEALSIEDSGKRISGDFVIKSVEDDYGNKNLQAVPASTFRFEEGGGFKTERGSGSAALSVEEGTYIISEPNVLVLYVEKVGGELLSEARVRRFIITDQSADGMRLQSNPSKAFVLQKK